MQAESSRSSPNPLLNTRSPPQYSALRPTHLPSEHRARAGGRQGITQHLAEWCRFHSSVDSSFNHIDGRSLCVRPTFNAKLRRTGGARVGCALQGVPGPVRTASPGVHTCACLAGKVLSSSTSKRPAPAMAETRVSPFRGLRSGETGVCLSGLCSISAQCSICSPARYAGTFCGRFRTPASTRENQFPLSPPFFWPQIPMRWCTVRSGASCIYLNWRDGFYSLLNPAILLYNQP